MSNKFLKQILSITLALLMILGTMNPLIASSNKIIINDEEIKNEVSNEDLNNIIIGSDNKEENKEEVNENKDSLSSSIILSEDEEAKIFEIKDNILIKAGKNAVNQEGIVEIPDGVTTIAEGAFIGLNVKEIILPKTVKTIKANALSNIGLEKINLESVEIIEESALANNHIKNVNLSAVLDVKKNAFKNNEITKVYVKDAKVINNAFDPIVNIIEEDELDSLEISDEPTFESVGEGQEINNNPPIGKDIYDGMQFCGEIEGNSLISHEDLVSQLNASIDGKKPSLPEPADEVDEYENIRKKNVEEESKGGIWLKFVDYKYTRDGKPRTFYVMKKPIRKDVSWNALFKAGAVYGWDVIKKDGSINTDLGVDSNYKPCIKTINGQQYIVRLLRGVSNYGDSVRYKTGNKYYQDTDAPNSEWNRTILPITQGYRFGSSTFNNNYAEQALRDGDTVDYSKRNYNVQLANYNWFSDLTLGAEQDWTYNNNSYTGLDSNYQGQNSWAQEFCYDSSIRSVRGVDDVGYGAAYSDDDYSSKGNSWRGVRLVLEPYDDKKPEEKPIKPLENAVFALIREDKDEQGKTILVIVDTQISDKDGNVEFKNVDTSRDYVVKEVIAPDGYLINQEYLKGKTIKGSDIKGSLSLGDIPNAINDSKFIFSGPVVTGLTEKGRKYFESNPNDFKVPEESPYGIQINSIGPNAFKNLGLTDVVFPENIQSIGANAFSGNKLTKVVLPEKLTTISEGVFANNQITEVPDLENIKEIGYGAFFGNSLREVTIPANVQTIGERAFYDNNINKVTILGKTVIKTGAFAGKEFDPGSPGYDSKKETTVGNNIISLSINDVVEIGDYAFYNNKIPTVNFRNNLRSIGKGAFENNSIENLTFNPDCELKEIKDKAFKNNAMKSLVLSSNIEEIGQEAFASNHIKTVNVPDSLVKLNDTAFIMNSESGNLYKLVVINTVNQENKNKLTSYSSIHGGHIIDPEKNADADGWLSTDFIYTQSKDGRTVVLGFSKQGLEKLKTTKNVSLPLKCTINGKESIVTGVADSLDLEATKLQGETFKAKGIEKINIPQTYINIGKEAFKGNNLITLDLKNVSIIEESAFENNKISEMVYEKLTNIGKAAFKNNKNIKEINAKNFEEIGESAFEGNSISELTLHSNLKILGKSAFKDNKIENLNITDLLINKIEDSVFENNKLKNVDIPAKILTIGKYAFRNNEIEELSIKHGLKTIEEEAFAKNKLIEVQIPETLETVHDKSFIENGKIVNLKTFDFKNPNNIQNYTDPTNPLSGHKVISQEDESVGGIWTYADFEYKDDAVIGFSKQGLEKLKLSKDISLPRYNPFKYNTDGSREVYSRIEDYKLITKIAENAFAGKEIETVNMSIMTDLETISKGAFKNNNIQNIIFNDSKALKVIEANAFENNKIKYLTIPENLTTINEAAFKNNEIEELVIKEGLESIEKEVFAQNNLETLTLPQSINSINDLAFIGNPEENLKKQVELYTFNGEDNGLTSYKSDNGGHIINPSSEVSNEYFIFAEIDGKTTVTGMTKQGAEKFKGKIIKLPSTDNNGKKVEAVGPKSFYDLDLKGVYLPESINKIGEYAFAKNKIRFISQVNNGENTLNKFNGEIGDYAFYNNILEKVNLDDVSSIGKFAFAKNNIDELSWSEKLKTLSKGAFNDNLLKTLDFSKTSLDKISEQAFMDNKLEYVNLGNIKRVENRAFMGNFLTSSKKNSQEDIQNSYTDLSKLNYIGDNAFASNNFYDIEIPVIEHIGKDAFIRNGKNVFLYTEVLISGQKYSDGYSLIVNPIQVTFKFVDQDGNKIKSDSINGKNYYEENVDFEIGKEVEYIPEVIVGYRALDKVIKFTPDKEDYVVTVKYQSTQIDPTLVAQDKIYTQNDGAGTSARITKEMLLKDVFAKDFEGRDITKDVKVKIDISPEQSYQTSGAITVENGEVTSVSLIGTQISQFNVIYSVVDSFGNSSTKIVKVYIGDKWKTDKDPNNWTYEDFTYSEDGRGPIITGFSASGKEKLKNANLKRKLVLPSFNPITMVPITEIGKRAFYKNEFEEIIFPSSLRAIREGAFEDNKLKTLTVPDGVEIIDNGAFYNNILTDVTLPGTLKSIGEGAFAGKLDLPGWEDSKDKGNNLTKIIVPNGVKRIAPFAFANNSIKSASLSNELISIGDSAFLNNQLTSIKLSNKLQTIGNRAFQNNFLKEVLLPETLTKIGESAFENNKLEKAELPDGLKHLGSRAFYNNNLTSAYISENIIDIGTGVYYNNPIRELHLYRDVNTKNILPLDKLETLYVGKNKKTILDGEFETDKAITSSGELGNLGLSKVVLVDGVETIGNNAFRGNSITSLIVPDTTTSIGNNAFENNPISKLSLGQNLEKIGSKAFYKNRITALTIPDSVTDIGTSAFESNQIENLFLGKGLKTISDNSFANNKINEINIPENVTSIGNNAFINNRINKLIIGDKVNKIGTSAFKNNNITELVLPNSLEIIEDNVFENNRISNLVFSKNTKIIGEKAFYNNDIKSLEIPSSVEYIYKQAFYQNNVEKLKLLANLKYFTTPAKNSNKASDWIEQIKILELGGNKTIVQKGEFKNAGIEELILNNVEEIKSNAFEGNNIISVKLPETLKTIESNSFKDNKITILNIPDSVNRIESAAFQNNPISNLTIGKNVTSIGDNAFSFVGTKTTNISELIIPDSVITIGNSAFKGSNINNLKLGNNINVIGSQAFSDNKITNIIIPDSVSEIKDKAFYNNGVKSIKFGKGLKIIGAEIIGRNNIPSGTSFELPMIQEINPNAFLDASNPNKVYYLELPGYKNDFNIKSSKNHLINPSEITIKYLDADTKKEIFPTKHEIISQEEANSRSLTFNPITINSDGISSAQKETLKKYKQPDPIIIKKYEKTNEIVFEYYKRLKPTIKVRFVDINTKQDIAEPVLLKNYMEGDEIEKKDQVKEIKGYVLNPKIPANVKFLVKDHDEDLIITYEKIVNNKNDVVLYTKNKMPQFNPRALIGNDMTFFMNFSFNRKQEGANQKIRLYFDDKNVDMSSISIGETSGITSNQYTINRTGRYVEFDVSNLPMSTSLELPITCKFNRYITPDNYRIYPRAVYMVGDEEVVENSNAYIEGYYEKPNGVKEINESTSFGYEDFGDFGVGKRYLSKNKCDMTYTFNISHLERNISKVEIVDKLPVYNGFDEQTKTVVKMNAIFEQSKNPDWTLKDGKLYYTSKPEEYSNGSRNLKFPSLILSFPYAVLGDNIRNDADIILTPHEQGPNESKMIIPVYVINNPSGKDNLKGIYSKNIYEPHNGGKLNTAYFYDIMTKGEKLYTFPWEIRLNNESGVANDGVIFDDFSIDNRMKLVGVRIKDYGLVGGILRGYDQNGTLLEEKTITTTGDTRFNPNIENKVRRATLEFGKNNISYFKFAFLSELINPSSVKYEPYGTNFFNNKAKVTCLNGRYDATDQADLLMKVAKAASNAVIKSSYVYNRKDNVPGKAGSYTVGVDGNEDLYAVNPKFKNFKQITLLPPHVKVTGVVPNSQVSSSVNYSYKIVENYKDGRTAVIIQGDGVEASENIAKIETVIEKDCPAMTLTADTYAFWDNEDIEKLRPSRDLLSTISSKASLTHDVLEAVELSPFKEISNDGKTWEQSIYFNNINSDGTATYYYKLTMNNKSNSNRTGLEIIDNLPVVGDGRYTTFNPNFVRVVSVTPGYSHSINGITLKFKANAGTVMRPSDNFEAIIEMRTPKIDYIDEQVVYNDFKYTDDVLNRDTPGEKRYLNSNIVKGTIKVGSIGIKAKKIDEETKKPLAGVVIGLFNKTDVANQKRTTDSNGIANFDLPKNYKEFGYYFKEISALNGYDVNLNKYPIPDNVKEDTVITITNKKVPAPPVPALASIKIKKIGNSISKNALKGVVFRLRGNDSRTLAIDRLLTTDENGEIFVKGLILGKYTINEVSSINNLQILEETRNITLSQKDQILTCDFTNDKASIKLVKLGIDNNLMTSPVNLTGDEGEAVSAKFKLYSFDIVDEKHVNEKFIADISINNGKAALISNLPTNKNYKIVETESPSGYGGLKSVEFKIDSYGILRDLAGQEFISKNKVFYPNYKLKEFKLKKIEVYAPQRKGLSFAGIQKLDGKSLSDAEFILYKNDKSDPNAKTITIGEDSYYSLGELEYDTKYILSETKTPNGYEKDKDMEFMVSSDNKIKFLDTNEVIELSDTGNSTNPYKLIKYPNVKLPQINIAKISVTAKEYNDVGKLNFDINNMNRTTLGGAKFKLLKEGQVVEEYKDITSVTGEMIELKNLSYDTLYTIEEMQMPDDNHISFEQLKELKKFNFKILRNGNIVDENDYVYKDKYFEKIENGTLKDKNGKTKEYLATIVYPNVQKAKITIRKLSIDLGQDPNFKYKDIFDSKILEKPNITAGAKFSLYDGDKLIKTINLNTESDFTNLEFGKVYTLKEDKAPNGHAKYSEDIKFIINTDGTVESEDHKIYPRKNGDNYTIYVPNEKQTSISIYKLGIRSEKAKSIIEYDGSEGSFLENSKFEILENGVPVVLNREGSGEEFTEFTVQKSDLGDKISGIKYNQYYTLRETVSPAGYTPLYKEVEFMVDKDGNIFDKDGNKFVKNILYFPNVKDGELSDINIKKSGNDGKKLAGAEFKLFKKDFSGKYYEYKVGTTDASGLLKFADLPGGEYRVYETKAPAGYAKTHEYKDFTLSSEKSEKNLEWVVVNNKIEFKIRKLAKIDGKLSEGEANAILKDFIDRGYKNVVLERDNGTDEWRVVMLLSDAIFEIREKESGKKIGEGKSDVDGIVTFYDNMETKNSLITLEEGKVYEIEEISSPSGYIKSEKPIVVTIDDFSKTEKFDGKIKLDCYNKKNEGSLTVVKRDLEDSRLLEGAEFALYYRAPNTTDLKFVEKGVTDKYGQLVFEYLGSIRSKIDITKGVFIIKETKAPKFYIMDDKEYVVKFNSETDNLVETVYNKKLSLFPYTGYLGAILTFVGLLGVLAIALFLRKKAKDKDEDSNLKSNKDQK